MSLKYLIDENVDPAYPKQIRRREPSILIKVVGELEPATYSGIFCQSIRRETTEALLD